MQNNELTVKRATAISLLQDSKMIDNLNAFAGYMATGDLMTPEHFKGKPADCFMLSMQALQWGMNPISVASQAFPINGRLSYGAPLVIAIILQSGMVEPRPHFSPAGDWSKKGRLNGNRFENESGLGVRVGFKFIGDSSPTYSETIYLSDQIVRNSPLWKSDPYQQLCYVGAKRWSNLYMPGATMGLHIESDSQDLSTTERDVTPKVNGNDHSNDVDFSNVVASAQAEPLTTGQAQVGIEEITNTSEVIEQAGEQVQSTTIQPDVRKIESLEPKNGDLDELGTALDFEIHTGTQLRNGSWRLNKKGRELQEAAENQEQSTESAPANEILIVDKYIIAIQKDAIEMLGSDVLIVEHHNVTANTVTVNGQEFPVGEGDVTYLAFCNEDGEMIDELEGDNPFAAK